MSTELTISSFPIDILIEIFSHLSSKDRSVICSVSKQFETVALTTSMKLYPSRYWLELYDPDNDLPFDPNQKITSASMSDPIAQILMNYHLTVRVKPIDISLGCACSVGDLDTVMLAKTQSTEEEYDTYYEDAFISACIHGDINVIKYMVTFDIDVHVGAEFTCWNGPLDNLIYLLEFDTGVLNETYDQCLRQASRYGQLDIAEYLIGLGKISKDGEMAALAYAGDGGDIDMVEYLLETFGYGHNLCILGAARWGRIHIVERLLYTVPISQLTFDSIFEEACAYGQIDVIKYLIETLKDGLVIDYNKGLRVAIKHKQTKLGDYLISLGAVYDLDDSTSDEEHEEYNRDEYWALHNAGYDGHLEIAKNLINEYGWGLMVVIDSAVRGRWMNIVSELLYSEPLTQYNFDVLWRSACERGGREMVDYLIETLAPGLVIDYNDGLYSAYFGEKDEIADYLISLGAVDGPDMWGWHERNGISYSDESDESYEDEYDEYVDDDESESYDISGESCEEL